MVVGGIEFGNAKVKADRLFCLEQPSLLILQIELGPRQLLMVLLKNISNLWLKLNYNFYHFQTETVLLKGISN